MAPIRTAVLCVYLYTANVYAYQCGGVCVCVILKLCSWGDAMLLGAPLKMPMETGASS